MKVYEVISEAGLMGAQGARNPARAAVVQAAKFRRVMASVSRRRKNIDAESSKWAASWSKRLGPWMWLLKLIGIGTACYELWTDLGAAEEGYQAGEYDEATFKDFRQFYQGVFVAQIIVPAVAKAIVTSRYVTWIARFVIRIIEGGTGVLTAGASIAAMVGTEMFFSWFTGWLGSDQAKDWLSNYLLVPLIFVGSVPDTAWNMLTGYYEKQDKKRTDAGKPSGKQPGDASDSYFGSVKPKIEPVVVGGVNITDEKGYLDPYAMSSTSVRAALADPQTGPELAKKIAALPKKPLSDQPGS